MSTITRMLIAVSFVVIGAITTNVQAEIVLISDDFSSGTVSNTFRIYENTIDDGWFKGPASYGLPPQPESAWTITGGTAQNASFLAATGYPNSKAAEAPLYNFFSGGGSTETHLSLSFDYSVASGDMFYAHLWGITGTSNDDGEFVSNIEGSANGNVNLNAGTGDTTELTTYNLTDGAASGFGGTATSISGNLTGSGTFSTSFNIADLGIGGVTTAGDLDYYVIQFAKNEDGTPGTTSIDNFQLSAVPEPTSVAMFSLALLSLGYRRRR